MDRDSAISGVLPLFGVKPESGDVSFPGGGFSGAVIARVKGVDGDYSLRGWPVDSLPVKRIRGLHRLLGHIQHQGVDFIAVPMATESGDTLPFHQGRYWQLEPWLPGMADFWDNPNERRLRAAMRCLAQWHRAAATFVPRGAEGSWFGSQRRAHSPAVGERLERTRELLAGGGRHLAAMLANSEWSEFRDIGERILQVFPQAAALIAPELARLKHATFPLQPCLRDVWHDHLLWTGDDVSGLIDPSACRTENVATDLARLLGSLVADDDALWQVALAEYRQVRKLTGEELALLTALDRSTVVLAGLTWIERSGPAGAGVSHEPRVVRRMQVIERRLSRLLQS